MLYQWLNLRLLQELISKFIAFIWTITEQSSILQRRRWSLYNYIIVFKLFGQYRYRDGGV